MKIQRLRSLTTGILHTEVRNMYEDIEFLTDTPGIFTHMIPNAMKAMEPWLREKVTDERFWDGEFDQTHTGEIDLEPMTQEEKEKFFKRFGELPSLLEGKDVIVVESKG